ncbi:hypothetical protein LROSL1_1451 [Furfurilactobacillus rossiae]|nr:UPF0223 family protein [Furfurilactobacillus rossiae]QLE64268.1 hypothetical protein LROSL1_1451 [Furfurilactobacillus rossiae]
MKTNIDLPLDDQWSRQEIVVATRLYELVLEANETGADREKLLAAYDLFTQMMPSKGQRRQLDRQFEKQAGVSIYTTIKQAQSSPRKRLRIE